MEAVYVYTISLTVFLGCFWRLKRNHGLEMWLGL